VKDKKFATALEVIGGAKLHHIVLKDKATIKPLVRCDAFKRKVTLIPLREVKVRLQDPSVIKVREDKFNVVHVLNAINTQDHFKKAMAYAFGDFYICKDN
jgi:chromosome segregation ATPase